MRNLRKLTAVVIAIALVLTSMTAVFAASTSFDFETEAGVIKDLGLWTGNDDGDLMLAKELTRAEGAVLVLKAVFGKTNDDAADADPSVYASFDDAAEVPAWAEGWIALAVEAGVVKGSNNNLNAAAPLLGKDLASMFMNALGYADENDYGTSVELLAAKTNLELVDALIEDLTDAKLTRDAAAAIVFDALTATAADAEVTLVEALVADNADLKAVAEAAGLIEVPVVSEFKVKDIIATNLHTLKIDFTKAIDSASVTADTLKVEGTNVGTPTRYVTDDKMSVVIVYGGTLAQSTTLTITVNGVKSTDGAEIKDFAQAKVAADNTFPELTGAVANNAKQIEVFTSEPMQNAFSAGFQVINNVKLDGVSIIAKITANDVKNSLVIDFPSPIKAGNHTLKITGFKDYANYLALDKEFTVTVAEDTVAPTIIAAEAKNLTEIEVTFSEMIDVLGTIKVNGATPSDVKVVDNSNGTKYKVTLAAADALTMSSIVEVKITYKDQADAAGNKVSTEQTFTFKLADDTTLPTVAATIDSNNKVVLTFSKTMKTNVGSINVKDKDGKALAGYPINVSAASFKSNSNNAVIELTLPAINAQEITVVVSKMQDGTIRANLLPEATIKLAASDKVAPTVDAEYFVKAGDKAENDTVTFYFNEAMDNATMTNLSNYVIGGESLAAKSASVSSVSADGKTIVIKCKDARLFTTDFTVFAIKDLAGNMMTTKTDVKLKTSFGLSFAGVETSDGIKIKVKFNSVVVSVDPSVFKVVDASGDVAVFVNAELASDGKSADFTANKNLGTDVASYSLAANNTSIKIKNIYGSELTVTNQSITDKVKPTATVAAASTAGAITISFTETVKVDNLATLAADLIVKNKDGVIVDITTTGAIQFLSAAGAVVADPSTGFKTIVFAGNTAENYTVALFGRYIKDVNANNIVTEVAATAITTK